MSTSLSRMWVIAVIVTSGAIVFVSYLKLTAQPVPAANNQALAVPAMTPVVPSEYNGDVRSLPAVPQTAWDRPEHRSPENLKRYSPAANALHPVESNIPMAPMPSPIVNFNGVSKLDACVGGNCGNGWPPDINGEVGPNHFIEAVNSSYAIYSKAGTLLATFTENALWGGSGQPQCEGNAEGDPVVVYDRIADRWILSHFAFGFDINGDPTSPFYQCIAASKTGDPVAGGWWLYAVRMDTGGAGPPVNTLNDYGKFGTWIDCLYFAANGFLMPAGSFNGVVVAAFNRSNLYSGAALTGSLGFLSSANDAFTLLPSNISGPAVALPAVGTPNYFVSEGLVNYEYLVRKFTVNAACGSGVLGAPAAVSQTSYPFPPDSDIVPQPTTANVLDSLTDRLMQKAQYRKVGAVESLWVAHSVYSSAPSTMRPQWAQINVSGGTVVGTPVQQQIYAPDTTLHRWMPGIAADKMGNMALAYSTSSSASFPSVAYSGRLVGDAANTLPQSEVQLIAGGGSQTNTCGGAPCHRWGDYTSLSVDPDGCTFWVTNEYYDTLASGTSGNWHTRIGSFKFPGCTVATFTDAALGAGTVINVIHITELRTRINALRAAFGIAAFSFTDPGLAAGNVIKAVHITELRTALAPVYTAALRAAPTYTDPALGAGTVVKAIHVQELRSRVTSVE